MKTIRTVRRIAPEDIVPGIFVILHETVDVYYAPPMECSMQLQPYTVVRVPEGAQRPMRVVDACLPYVRCVSPTGRVVQYDLRRHRLVKLEARYAYALSRSIKAEADARKDAKDRA